MTTTSTQPTWRPAARLGWWAIWLMATFALMFIVNVFVFSALPTFGDGTWRQTFLPAYAIIMLTCGLAAGVAGLTAIIRQKERSWLVWLAILPFLWVIFMLVGELLFPH